MPRNIDEIAKKSEQILTLKAVVDFLEGNKEIVPIELRNKAILQLQNDIRTLVAELA